MPPILAVLHVERLFYLVQAFISVNLQIVHRLDAHPAVRLHVRPLSVHLRIGDQNRLHRINVVVVEKVRTVVVAGLADEHARIAVIGSHRAVLLGDLLRQAVHLRGQPRHVYQPLHLHRGGHTDLRLTVEAAVVAVMAVGVPMTAAIAQSAVIDDHRIVLRDGLRPVIVRDRAEQHRTIVSQRNRSANRRFIQAT